MALVGIEKRNPQGCIEVRSPLRFSSSVTPRSSTFQHPSLRSAKPTETLASRTSNNLAASHITAQHITSMPGLPLLASNPNSLTPVFIFVTTRVVFGSYAPLRSHQGQESGGAHWPGGGCPRARPSWNDLQLLKFLPSAQGFLMVIHAWRHARDLK